MNIKKAIEKMEALQTYLASTNGFNIYDIMHTVYRDNGHGQKLERWGPSGIVFYSEDDALVEKLNDVNRKGKLADVKEFLLANLDSVKELQELRNKGLKEMNDKEFMAFNHLRSADIRKLTFQKCNYGSAHIIEEDKMLLFFQGHPAIREHFNANLNISSNYLKAQNALIKQYQAGKIESDGQLTGGALDKVMDALLDIKFTNLSKHQKETVLFLQDFTTSVLTDAKFHTSLKEGNHTAYFTRGTSMIEVVIPTEKKDEFVVKNGGKYFNVDSMNNLLTYMNKEMSQDLVNRFLSQKKKM